MSHYRAYFLQDDHIAAPEGIEASTDAEAMIIAGDLLSRSQFTAIEVWQETRIVGSLSGPREPDNAGPAPPQ